MGRPRKLVVEKLFSDKNISLREGHWMEESDIKHPIINSNTDVYYRDENNNLVLLLKFRKNCIDDTYIKVGWDSYKNLAKASRGRGASAGQIDPDSDYWKKRNLIKTKKWSTGYLTPQGNLLKEEYEKLSYEELLQKAIQLEIKEKNITKERDELLLEIIKAENGFSKMKVNNQVASNPIGFYEQNKNLGTDLPCRLTHFTRTNFDKYNKGLPFLQKIDSLFEKLIPESHQKQLARADKKPHLKIPGTSFSTVTINRNFRTALHRDAGDFKDGFGNLTVMEQGKYHGGYTVFPQFGVGINLRNNDFCAMDVHQWHANTPIHETEEDKEFNETIESDFKDNPLVGTAGLYQKYTRISFVCYLREKIANCPAVEEIDPRFLTKSGHSKIKD